MAKNVAKGGAMVPVKKAGNTELAAILADIQSLLKQVLANEQAEETDEGGEGGEGAAGAVGMSVKKAKEVETEGIEPEEGDEGVEKDETARSDAEDRIEELPDDDKNALAAIGKTLLALQSRSVAKSASVGRPDQTTQILAGIAKSLDAINRRVASNEEALVGIMEGMGVAELVQKSATVAKPVQAPDTKAFLDMLAEAMVQKSGTAQAEPEMGLGDALLALAGGRPNQQ